MPMTMENIVELLVALLLLVGSFFTLVGAIGLVRLPDFFMRLHAPTKATTLGVGGMLLASIVYSLNHSVTLHELLITLFLFVTAPVSASLLAKAALHLRMKSRAPLPEDQTSGR
jgi:multicomponent K+:H+ antiporter subunit G